MKELHNSKNFKRIISVLMLLILLIAIISTTLMNYNVQAEEEINTYGDFEYVVLTDGIVMIIDYTGNDSIVTVPDKIDGKPVTRIWDHVFEGYRELTEIILPDSITYIGSDVFRDCTSLEKIKLPDGVTSIVYCDFFGCSSLSEFEIPKNVTSIGGYAFKECRSLTEITIPDSVTSIGDRAFENCSSLTKITIPDSVTYIGAGILNYSPAVIYCYENSYAHQYAIDNSIEYYLIDSDYIYEILDDNTAKVMGYKGAGTKITIPDKLAGHAVSTIGEEAFSFCYGITEIILPETLTTIEADAFSDCGITEIVIPEGVLSIGDGVFSGSTKLMKVSLPSTLNVIGEDVFWGTRSLVSIEVNENSDTYASVNGVLFTKDKTKLLACGGGVESYELPDGVTIIGHAAFGDNTNLQEVTLPDSLRIIEENAFIWCYQLKDVVLPDGLETIEDGAFALCGSVRKITIPKSVTSIGEDVFYRFSGDNSEVTIYCYANSVAYQYAIENEHGYVLIDSDVVIGDVNGDGKVTSIDARFTLQAAAGNYSLDETAMLAADANGDGKVTSIDARLILQAAAGNIVL